MFFILSIYVTKIAEYRVKNIEVKLLVVNRIDIISAGNTLVIAWCLKELLCGLKTAFFVFRLSLFLRRNTLKEKVQKPTLSLTPYCRGSMKKCIIEPKIVILLFPHQKMKKNFLTWADIKIFLSCQCVSIPKVLIRLYSILHSSSFLSLKTFL